MSSSAHNSDSLQFTLALKGPCVAESVEAAKAFLASLDVLDATGVCVVLRELLVNAIEHGSKDMPEKEITWRILHAAPGHIRLDVEDQGEGFDYTRLNLALPEDPRHITRHGYLIINALCKRLEFNDKGNHVSAHIAVEEKDAVPRNSPAKAPARKGGSKPWRQQPQKPPRKEAWQKNSPAST